MCCNLLGMNKEVIQTIPSKLNICITFIQRRPNVFDVGPTLYKCYANVLCLLWMRSYIFRHSLADVLCDFPIGHHVVLSDYKNASDPQQTKAIDSMLILGFGNCVDGWPTSNQHWGSVCCLLGRIGMTLSVSLFCTLKQYRDPQKPYFKYDTIIPTLKWFSTV